MKKIFPVVLFVLAAHFSFAQFAAGIAYGTFKVPGAGREFKGYGPTLGFAYTGRSERVQTFLDASLYKKNIGGMTTGIYDDEGVYVGTAELTQQYSIAHMQLGFKASLAGDFTDSKLNCFVGGGAAASFVKTTEVYHLPDYKIPDDQFSHMTYGFHFNTGGQWRVKPVILELSGNFDLVLKPITTESDAISNILTSLRLGLKVPIQ